MQKPIWVDAMVEEYDSIINNSAWEIFSRLVGKSMVGSRWIYKVKRVADGSVEKYKEKFVARGFSQVEGIEHEETFTPVARYSWIIYPYTLNVDGLAHSSDGCENCVSQWSY